MASACVSMFVCIKYGFGAPVFRSVCVSLMHVCVRMVEWDAVVLVFSFLFRFSQSNLIHSVLQDIIFSHGVPAMRTELFCNRVASKIL